MKINKKLLEQLIKDELSSMIKEGFFDQVGANYQGNKAASGQYFKNIGSALRGKAGGPSVSDTKSTAMVNARIDGFVKKWTTLKQELDKDLSSLTQGRQLPQNVQNVMTDYKESAASFSKALATLKNTAPSIAQAQQSQGSQQNQQEPQQNAQNTPAQQAQQQEPPKNDPFSGQPSQLKQPTPKTSFGAAKTPKLDMGNTSDFKNFKTDGTGDEQPQPKGDLSGPPAKFGGNGTYSTNSGFKSSPAQNTPASKPFPKQDNGIDNVKTPTSNPMDNKGFKLNNTRPVPKKFEPRPFTPDQKFSTSDLTDPNKKGNFKGVFEENAIDEELGKAPPRQPRIPMEPAQALKHYSPPQIQNALNQRVGLQKTDDDPLWRQGTKDMRMPKQNPNASMSIPPQQSGVNPQQTAILPTNNLAGALNKPAGLPQQNYGHNYYNDTFEK